MAAPRGDILHQVDTGLAAGQTYLGPWISTAGVTLATVRFQSTGGTSIIGVSIEESGDEVNVFGDSQDAKSRQDIRLGSAFVRLRADASAETTFRATLRAIG